MDTEIIEKTEEQQTEEQTQESNSGDDGFGDMNAKSVKVTFSGEEGEESGSNSSEEEDESSESGEEGSEESSDGTSTEDGTETSAENSEGDSDAGGTESQSSESTSSEQQEKESGDYNEEEAYLALSEETGVEVSSDDDVVNALTELASLRKNGGAAELSQAIQSAIAVEKSGGNLSEHFARVSMDFEKMDAKEVLRQQFFKSEAKLHGTNPELARMKFDRKFTEKYGKWASYEALTDEDDKKDYLEEHQADIDYEKMMFTNDAETAREELNVWKSEVKPVEKQATEGGMTEQESTEYAEEYSDKAKVSLSKFNAVSIQMGEGIKDFALGLNETTKPMVEGWVSNPATFLQDIGFDGQKIDTDRLLPIMTLIAEASNGNLGGRIAKYAVDSEDVSTIKKTLDKPEGKTGVTVESDKGEMDLWEKVGEAAEQANEALETTGR